MVYWVIITASFAVAIQCLLPTAAAQSCAMCYQTAAAAAAPAREALRHGILILLFPAAGLFLGIFGYVWRRES